MPKALNRDIGPVIRSVREQRGLKQAAVARAAKTTADYLCKIETGKRGCSEKLAARVARVLGVSLAELKREMANG